MARKKFEQSASAIRVISLFSGCGGMDFGIEAAGAKVVYANDVNAHAVATLKKYFPDCDINHGNISKAEKFPKADVVVGGYPCQSFSMAGNRQPAKDDRSSLYKHFLRIVCKVQPNYFVAENVTGLKQLSKGIFLARQIEEYSAAGYDVYSQVLNAADYGVPQFRKRLFIVGIKKKLKQRFVFPSATHGLTDGVNSGLLPYVSHGDTINGLPLWPTGEFYEREHDPEGHFSWYYMSRNRKAPWDGPAFTVVANWRHITLHPASPDMKMAWSNLKDGFKQRWEFVDSHAHAINSENRPRLDRARRLSWRECSLLQTFPENFEPCGDTPAKFTQIGNAVPPLLAEALFRHLFSGAGLESPEPANKAS